MPKPPDILSAYNGKGIIHNRAKGNIGIISAYATAGRLTLEKANQLIAMQKAFIESRAIDVMEERLAVLERQYKERPPQVSSLIDGSFRLADSAGD